MTFAEDAARVAAVVDGATCTVTLFAQSSRLRVFFTGCEKITDPSLQGRAMVRHLNAP
jgi:hypothetical protein